MHRVLSAGAAALALACSGVASDEPAIALASHSTEPVVAAAPSERIRVVLAASFGTGGTCRKKALSGCDLFLAEYDLGTRSLVSAERLAGAPGVADDFPVIDPQGRFVVYQRERGGQHDLMYASLLGGGEGKLVDKAREPALSSDGALLAYTAYLPKRTFAVRMHPVTAAADGTPTLGPAETVLGDGSSSEPYFLPGDQQLAFYRKGSRPHTGQTRILDRQSGAQEAFSDEDGCAHGTVSPSGDRMLCQSSGKLRYRERQADGGWGPLLSRSYPSPEDPAFSDCGRLTFGHPEFCGSSGLVLATYSCMNNNALENAQMMLFDWDSGVVARLSREVAAALGQEGEARSGVCLPR